MRSALHATLPGLAVVTLVTVAAYLIAELPALKAISLSPIAVGILLGIIIGNSAPPAWRLRVEPGVIFSTKKLLKAAIVFYGFRITFLQIFEIGWRGLAIDILIVVLTMLLGFAFGTKVLRMDWRSAVLTSAGSSICGAAAVVSTEPIVRAESHQTSAAVGTVVVFGTLSMFLYPLAFRSGLIPLSEDAFGIYIGATIHGVSHVVGAAGTVSDAACDSAMITKMTRVMLLAPFLLILSVFTRKRSDQTASGNQKITIPWFALGFIAVAGINSLALFPVAAIESINTADTFVLGMSMTALGMNTVLAKLKGMAMKSLYLAAALFVWLVLGGYALTLLLVS